MSWALTECIQDDGRGNRIEEVMWECGGTECGMLIGDRAGTATGTLIDRKARRCEAVCPDYGGPGAIRTYLCLDPFASL